MRKRKVDSNQADLVKQIRRIPGATVALTHTVANGFPDAVLGFRGRNYLLEIKDGQKVKSKRKLTPDEAEFHQSWTGQIAVIETIDDVLKLLSL